MYLDKDWPAQLHAETILLDEDAQIGVCVRPRAGRLLLMDQDCPHRISSPAVGAPRPRYSLVWKAVFWPRALLGLPTPVEGIQEPGLCRPEWGASTLLGNCAETFAQALQFHDIGDAQ